MKQINLNDNNYQIAFKQIDSVLHHYYSIWHHRPFVIDPLPWQHDRMYRNLSYALLSLTEQEWQTLNDEQHLYQWLSEFLPDLIQASQWHIPMTQASPIRMDKFHDSAVPGRKKEQIECFCGAFHPFYTGGHITDWCCGKGYLASHLHRQFNCNILAFDTDQRLIKSARKRSHKFQDTIQYQCIDAHHFTQQVPLNKTQWHSGLHACGALHMALLEHAVNRNQAAVISPCCYHLINTKHYQPLAKIVKSSDLTLNKEDLRLAVAHTVTASKKVKQQREVERLWRTAFDLWYRNRHGINWYTQIHSLPKPWLNGTFREFCQHIAQRMKIQISDRFEPSYWLALAQQKLERIKRLELARHGFRALMEKWLLLDRLLFLQQNSYDTHIVRFCEEPVTPRNTLIIAKPKHR